MTLNLSELQATEQAMSSAPWRWSADGDVIEDAADQIVLAADRDADYVPQLMISLPDRAGLVAARNALSVLLEIARAALEWQTLPQEPARAARKRLLAALSRVRP